MGQIPWIFCVGILCIFFSIVYIFSIPLVYVHNVNRVDGYDGVRHLSIHKLF